jgi:CspA family cold shock protein
MPNSINFRVLLIFYFFFMQEGTVKFFNETKGFGFIMPTSGGPEVFVHVSGLVDKVAQNDHVSYEVQDGNKGKNAVNVKKI